MRKRVGIVGAGVSGVGAVKICVELGLEPVCFERRNRMGGLWNTEHPRPPWIRSDAQIYKKLVQLATKSFYSYPDFPPLKEHPTYLSGDNVVEYIEAYTAHFGCGEHFKFGRNVDALVKAPDYAETGRWVLTHTDAKTKKDTVVETFDAVFLCSGYYQKAIIPAPLPTQGDFQGSIIHSGSFWDDKPYIGRRVLIVGGSQSAANIAAALASGDVDHIDIVARDGIWLIPQVLPGGKVTEDILFDHKLRTETENDFLALRNAIEKACTTRFDHGALGLCPRKPPLSGRLALVDELEHWIMAGRVTVRVGEIGEFRSRGVVLKDGTELTVDDVIYATGFRPEFAFLKDKSLFPESSPETANWMFFYPVEQEHPTLFLIGVFLLFSALPPLAELQSRAACMLLTGKLKPPSKKDLQAMMGQAKAQSLAVFGRWPPMHTEGYSIEVALSKFIGCYPDIEAIRKRSPDLADIFATGSLYPAYFRLLGPNAKWDEAAATIRAMAKGAFGRTAVLDWTPAKELPKTGKNGYV